MPEQCQGSYVCIVNVNNNMSKFDVYHRDVTGSLNDDKIIQTALEDFKTSIVTNKPILVEIQNHLWGFSLLAIIIRFWLSLIMIGQRNLFIL